jgi:2-methylaconitate isomerase
MAERRGDLTYVCYVEAIWEKPVIQRSLPAAFYRGGTSKAVIFRKEDLPTGEPPANCAEWDRLFLSLMGSPDAAGRQLDGMGGGISSLSKIAIVSPSRREDIDVDYTFAQIGVDKPVVSYRGNCGNIGSAIGPYALDEGMVSTNAEIATVRIFNTNTRKKMVAQFATQDGNAKVEGDFAIDGVSRPGSPIRLTFLDPAGAATGRLLPTGNVRDVLDIGGGRRIEASLVDVANPVVVVDMDGVCTEREGFDPAWFQSPQQRELFEDIRVAAAKAMGLVPDEQTARTHLTNLPLVSIVRRPSAYVTSSAMNVDPHQVDIVTQMISMGLPHKATPLTGAMCLAAASRIDGTIAHAVANPESFHRDKFRIGHPSGVMQVTASCEQRGDGWHVGEAGVFRTARRLFDGRVWMPDDNLA